MPLPSPTKTYTLEKPQTKDAKYLDTHKKTAQNRTMPWCPCTVCEPITVLSFYYFVCTTTAETKIKNLYEKHHSKQKQNQINQFYKNGES